LRAQGLGEELGALDDPTPARPCSLAREHDRDADAHPPTDSFMAVVLLGTGSGSFGIASSYCDACFAPSSVRGRRLQQDGGQDLAIATADSDAVSMLLGTGKGSFRPATNYSVDSERNRSRRLQPQRQA
jgi:hypothetical protein